MKQGIEHHSIGDAFDNFMLIKSASRGVASNGKPFLTLILRDVTGEIEAKLWDITREDEGIFLPEQIVRLSGEVSQFRGKPQMKIFSIRPSQPTDNVQVADFIEKAPIAPETLMEQLTEAIFEMTNPSVQRIVRALVKKYQQSLLSYPAAAKHHHAYASGLAYHTISMLSVAKKLHELYPQTNRDLLYAGVILHDMGKVKELSGLVTTSYTLEGQLLGHIPIMVEEVALTARELEIEGEEVLILQHLILSHHGKAEWGSPKMPLIREAELLHLIDLIDARMETLNRALDKVKPGEFTERLFGLDNRAFYKPAIDET